MGIGKNVSPPLGAPSIEYVTSQSELTTKCNLNGPSYVTTTIQIMDH